MKRIITILAAVIITANVFAQAPEKMSYQAVIRDTNNILASNQSVGMQISILQGSVTGTAVYEERHFPTTNANGLATVEIGNGTVVSGNFTTIDWANGPYFVTTETDLNGGSNFTIAGTSQLLSVPYALLAKNAENIDDADADPVNELQTLSQSGSTVILSNGGGAISIEDADADPTNELQSLNITGDTLSISNGNTITLPNDNDWIVSGSDIYAADTGNVGIGTFTPAAKLEVDGDFIRTIAYATGNGPNDQTNVGQIVSRTLTFTKKRDSTILRINYTDNLRTYSTSGAKSCRWEMQVNGTPCSPQPLIYDFYVGLAYEAPHRSRTLVGYCDGFSAGQHQIQIWVGPTPGAAQGDCSTGWNNSTWVIEVEEVNKWP